jgi:hypothetical protein
MGKIITSVIIGLTVVILVAYDLYAVLKWGIESTISLVIWHASQQWPIVPFSAGVLCGHLFAQNDKGSFTNKSL